MLKPIALAGGHEDFCVQRKALVGRFDYASIYGDLDLNADRYAVLVLSDALGADIRELSPPAR